MPYISSDDVLQYFPMLKMLYLEVINDSRGTTMDTSLQPSTIACFFGAKNISIRMPQIAFLEFIFSSQKSKLKLDLVFYDELEMQRHVIGLRIITAASLFIKDEIKRENMLLPSGSLLNKTLDKILALVGNEMDIDSELSCCLEAQKFVAETDSFHIVYWKKFEGYLNQRCGAIQKAAQNPYPITKTMMPIFTNLFRSIGRESGRRFAEACQKSQPALGDLRYAMTVAITSSLYFVLRPGRFGLSIMLFAPTLAEIVANTVCQKTIAALIENAIALTGQGVVFSVSMSLDMSLKILFHATQLLIQLLEASKARPRLSGFTLTDGQRIQDGMSFQLNLSDDAPPPYALEAHDEVAFEIEPEGLVLKHEADSSRIPWGNPITEARIGAQLAHFETLQDNREYEVLPSAPPLSLEM